MPLYHAAPRAYAHWAYAPGPHPIVRISGPGEHPYTARVALVADLTTKHTVPLEDLEPLEGQGHPVEKVASRRGLCTLLENISFPRDGYAPGGAQCDASVNGRLLHNGQAWPLGEATHTGVREPLGGCPAPVPQQHHSELYLSLRKHHTTVGQVNLAQALAWGAYSNIAAPAPPIPGQPQRITSRDELAALLYGISYPAEGLFPDQEGITAHVYGAALGDTGLWPVERAQETAQGSGEQWVEAGCPTPIRQPHNTELYIELRQYDQPVAYINLSTLLAWAAWDA